jgi:hypothetical protein
MDEDRDEFNFQFVSKSETVDWKKIDNLHKNLEVIKDGGDINDEHLSDAVRQIARFYVIPSKDDNDKLCRLFEVTQLLME